MPAPRSQSLVPKPRNTSARSLFTCSSPTEFGGIFHKVPQSINIARSFAGIHQPAERGIKITTQET
jgi:hypothetical protein